MFLSNLRDTADETNKDLSNYTTIKGKDLLKKKYKMSLIPNPLM